MKKVFIVIISLFSFTSFYSQVSKGNFLIGMSTTLSSIGSGPEMFGIGYSTNKTKVGNMTGDPTKTFGINLVPKVGYFVLSNVAIGIDGNLSYKKMKIESSGESQTSIFGGIGCFGRYYIPLSKIYPFFEFDAGLGKASVNYEVSAPYSQNENSDSKSFFYNLGAGIGLAIPLGNMVTFDLITGYDFIRELPNEKYMGQEIESTIHSFGFEIGVMVMFGGNKKSPKE